MNSTDAFLMASEAEQVRCVRCHADPGEPCHNTLTGAALHSPAHWQRIRDAAPKHADSAPSDAPLAGEQGERDG